MSDGVDVRLDAMQPPSPESMLDRAPPEPKLAKLRARHDSMLLFGDRRDRDIRLQRTMSVMGFATATGMVPSFGAIRLRVCALGY